MEREGAWLVLSDGFMVLAPKDQLMIDPFFPDTVRDINGNTTSCLSPDQKVEIAEHMIRQWAEWGGLERPR